MRSARSLVGGTLLAASLAAALGGCAQPEKDQKVRITGEREQAVLNEYVIDAEKADLNNLGENLLADVLGPDAEYTQFTAATSASVDASRPNASASSVAEAATEEVRYELRTGDRLRFRIGEDPATGREPLMVAVNNDVPAKTLKEFIDLAKAKPGQVTAASASTSQLVSSAMLASMTGVTFNSIPYKSGPAAMTDLIGGQVNMFTADFAVMVPQVKGGKVRGLAVTSTTRTPAAPTRKKRRSSGWPSPTSSASSPRPSGPSTSR